MIDSGTTERGSFDDFLARYPNAATGDFDGKPEELTEMDALIAYLQVLGRMVDFTTYNPQMNLR